MPVSVWLVWSFLQSHSNLYAKLAWNFHNEMFRLRMHYLYRRLPAATLMDTSIKKLLNVVVFCCASWIRLFGVHEELATKTVQGMAKYGLSSRKAFSEGSACFGVLWNNFSRLVEWSKREEYLQRKAACVSVVISDGNDLLYRNLEIVEKKLLYDSTWLWLEKSSSLYGAYSRSGMLKLLLPLCFVIFHTSACFSNQISLICS